MIEKLFKFWGTAFLLCLSFFFLIASIGILKSAFFSSDTLLLQGKDRVAVIELKGAIFKSSRFTRQVDELLEDKKIKALVVRINSPGGLVGPSQELYQSLKKADAQIPVVASIGSVGASGGYYAALGARNIFANPGSLTASIGVISEFANLEGLYRWAKIDRFTLKSGKLKDVGSETRKMTFEEKEFLLKMLQDIHSEFKLTVKNARKLNDQEVEKWTDGRVMTGAQAHQAKLVDALGGLDEAVDQAKKLAGLPEDAPIDFVGKTKKSVLKELLGSDEEDSLVGNGLGRFDGLVNALIPSRSGWRVLFMAPLDYSP